MGMEKKNTLPIEKRPKNHFITTTMSIGNQGMHEEGNYVLDLISTIALTAIDATSNIFSR